MADLDKIANNPQWQPASGDSLIRAIVTPPSDMFFGKRPISVEVKKLNNGLLYASVKDADDRNVIGFGGYDVEEVPQLPNQYRLINLSMRQREGLLGFFATFGYRDEGTINEKSLAKLEYTTWHVPGLGDKGLTMLTSLYAMQAVEGGWLDLHLNVGGSMPYKRGLTAKLICSGESNGELHFDENGEPVTKNVIGFKELPEHLEGPLKEIFRSTLATGSIDALETAVALFDEFHSHVIIPTQRALNLGVVASEQPEPITPGEYEPINNKKDYSITSEALNKAFQQGNIPNNCVWIMNANFGIYQMDVPHEMLVQMPESDIVSLYKSVWDYKTKYPGRKYDRSPQAFGKLISEMVGEGYRECPAIRLLKKDSENVLKPYELTQIMSSSDGSVIEQFLSRLELPGKEPVKRKTDNPNTFVHPMGYAVPGIEAITGYVDDFARMVGNVYFNNTHGPTH
jgi:hypothetical protein